MSFFCAGVYGEGPTDTWFLCKLLDRLLPTLAYELCKGVPELGDAHAIREPRRMIAAPRAERIAAAIDAYWGECTLFVVHSDGAGNPEDAIRQQILPGLDRARLTHPDLRAAACVPVREIEAWMLADASAFCRVFEASHEPSMPRDPEAEADPKAALKRVIAGLGARFGRNEARDYYALLGAEVQIEALRRLAAFRSFELELRKAVAMSADG